MPVMIWGCFVCFAVVCLWFLCGLFVVCGFVCGRFWYELVVLFRCAVM